MSLCVVQTGPGMAKELAKLLFEFYRYSVGIIHIKISGFRIRISHIGRIKSIFLSLFENSIKILGLKTYRPVLSDKPHNLFNSFCLYIIEECNISAVSSERTVKLPFISREANIWIF